MSLFSKPVTDKQLLAEVEHILRTMPPLDTLHKDTQSNLEWIAQLSAFINLWDSLQAVDLKRIIRDLHCTNSPSGGVDEQNYAKRQIRLMLYQANNDLRLKTLGPVNIAIGQGQVFHYFEELRKIIESANSDLLFIDPYLDADFVSRYLPDVTKGVPIRLLTLKMIATLQPAVEAFVQQEGATIQIRTSTNLHDRYVIVDDMNCYQSGASFKDGAKTAATTLTQITDVFTALDSI